ncbi:restriction endonuclease subunit S [Lonepinella sp. BR2474]|uniref:restriction endonuclease subunit S n=1 Tax=Lonepinella sp. BR2474 TaxID=3434548 RepID=UPI003F6DD776
MSEKNNNVPAIRFAGFTDAWERRKLGEILKIKSGMNQKAIELPTGIYPILATGGEIGRTNTALYNKESVLIGRKGTIDKPYYMNTPFWTVDTLFYSELSEKISGLFIYNLFQKINWRSYDTSTGVPSLTSSTIHNIEVNIPSSKAEQTQIGNFFKQLDDTIANHQRELEKYKNLKISYLEKMFPKENEAFPELRFPNFTDAWEQGKLGEIVEFYSGLTYSPSNVIDNNLGTLVLRSSNIQNSTLILDDNVYVNSNCVNSQNVEIGDIVVVVRNGSKNLIGKHAIVDKSMSNTVIGAFMTGIKYSNFDFLNALLNTEHFNYEIEKNLGATINQITTGAFKDMFFYFPTLPEQTQIGNFFKQLDDTIANHQRELEKYQKIKLAYLEKMFV